MKKSIAVLSLFFWAFTTILFARTPEQAAQLASQFFASQDPTSIPSAQRASQPSGTAQLPVELAYTQYTADATLPALYVFNQADQGFVLVSAEDDALPILGYSHRNAFDPDHIPANVAFWLKVYADDIADYRASVQSPAAQLARLQRRQAVPPASASAFTPVEPILGDVQWGQGTPYNDLAPTISGTKTPAGCVATAVAQIMYTHKHPTKGQGESSYRLGDQTISANFGATTYDWANMLPQYRAGQYTTTQKEAVSTLMYHVAVASHMYFGPSGSGAVSITAMEGLIQYFDYDAGIQTYMKDYVGITTMLQKIADELHEGRAIYMSGATVNNEGHAFVCDGINETGFLHINWGWDGSYDGYYALFALNPAEHGTGGSTSNLAFTVGVDIFLGIQPNQGGTPPPFVAVDAYTPNQSSFPINSAFSITCNRPCNFGLGIASGTVYIAAYDQDGQLCDRAKAGSMHLESYTMYHNFTFRADKGLNLPDGNYELAIELHNDQTSYPLWLLHSGAIRIPCHVDNGTIYLDDILPEEDIEPFHAISVYNQQQTNKWVIDASSEHFYDTAINGQSLSATIYSDSPTSIVGSYVLDPTHSGRAGTIAPDAIYALGNSDNNFLADLRDLYITISPADDGSLLLQCYINTKQIGTIQSRSQVLSTWYLYKDETTLLYDDYITYQLAATLPVTEALAICDQLPTTSLSPIHYYVTGRIAEMQTSPQEIISNNAATFLLSDNGTVFNTLYAHNIASLNDAYTTGTEVQPGYTVTIYGPLVHDEQSTIHGQLVAITPGEYIDYSVTSLRLVSLEGTNVTVAWETLAPQVEVSIYNSKRKLLGKRFMTANQISFAAPDEDRYTVYVQPADEQENYLAYKAELSVDVILKDYSIKNLQVLISDKTLQASWESPAKHFHVIIYDDGGNEMGNKIFSEPQLTAKLPIGEYQLWIRPMDNNKDYYLAGALTYYFTVAEPTDVDNIPSADRAPSASAVKRIHQGQLIILRADRTYNVLGQEL